MATKKQKEELLATLKFTPRIYKLAIWGRGSEYVVGKVPRATAEYLTEKEIDLSDLCMDTDNEIEMDEQHRFIKDGGWYECDDVCHEYGAWINSATLLVEDENGKKVAEYDLDANKEDLDIVYDEEVCLDNDGVNVLFVVDNAEKGTFWTADLHLTTSYDPTKLTISCTDINGDGMVTGATYDGVELENSDMTNTDSKGFFAQFIED